MIQEAGLKALTATALVRPQASLSGFCGGQSGMGAFLPWTPMLFLCHYHSTGLP